MRVVANRDLMVMRNVGDVTMRVSLRRWASGQVISSANQPEKRKW